VNLHDLVSHLTILIELNTLFFLHRLDTFSPLSFKSLRKVHSFCFQLLLRFLSKKQRSLTKLGCLFSFKNSDFILSFVHLLLTSEYSLPDLLQLLLVMICLMPLVDNLVSFAPVFYNL